MTISEAFEALEKESMGVRLRRVADELEVFMKDMLALGAYDDVKEAGWILQDIQRILEIHDAIEASVKKTVSAPTAG